MELPKCLLELTIGFDQKILLPRSIIYLSVGCKNTKKFVLEHGTEDWRQLYICVKSDNQHLTDNLPDNKNGIVLKHTLNNVYNLPKNDCERLLSEGPLDTVPHTVRSLTVFTYVYCIYRIMSWKQIVSDEQNNFYKTIHFYEHNVLLMCKAPYTTKNP